MVAFQLSGNANKDKWKNILVVHNANSTTANFEVPAGKWKVVVDGMSIDLEAKTAVTVKRMEIQPLSTLILAE